METTTKRGIIDSAITIDGMRHQMMVGGHSGNWHGYCTICEWSKYAKTPETVARSFHKTHGIA